MAILMIFEMTLSYQIVLPLMLAGVVAYFVSRAVAEVAMYEVTTVRERDVTLRNQLRHTVIRDLVRPADTVISTEAPVRDALQQFLEYPVKYLYVVDVRSEEHTSELQSLMRISYAVFCLKKKIKINT